MMVAGMLTRGMVAESIVPGASPAIAIDLGKNGGRLPHYWEWAGSDRLVVGLREQWRQDMIRARRETGMQAIRCHGLFNDEMGIATDGIGRLNFLYLDQIYDFMLDHGVRPFVELTFMPEAFASSNNRIFFYKGNTSPPRNWADWHAMVKAYAEHCVQRYGAAEVRQWKFEVWNEPNLGFWAGTQEEYFELYRQSALALKSVDKDLIVGGPATAQLGWVPDFLRYCSSKNVPVDFVSTHIYPDDPQEPVFGRNRMYSFEDVMPRGLALAKQQIESSAFPQLPLWITEWSSQNPAFICEMVKRCHGLAEAISYWTFSNVFEELGVPKGIFNNTYGMIDQWGIPRPSLHAFALLHRLGEERLQASEGPVLATRRADGSPAILVWNLLPASDAAAVANGNPLGSSSGSSSAAGAARTIVLRLSGLAGRKQVRVSRVGGAVGSAVPAWKSMGSPQYPSREQLAKLRAAAELPTPESHPLTGAEPEELVIMLPADGVALLEFER
jgi:xylan 1,4-beta-xylosidase